MKDFAELVFTVFVCVLIAALVWGIVVGYRGELDQPCNGDGSCDHGTLVCARPQGASRDVCVRKAP